MSTVVDLYLTDAGAFDVVPEGAVRPFEPPFVEPPPSFAECIEAIGEAMTVAIQPLVAAFAHIAETFNAAPSTQSAPDPKGNRAARRRKHAAPARPGWMQAFPATDPARAYRSRLAR